MRPLSLALRNFGAHQDSYINFRETSLASIIGQTDGINGTSNTAGKSTLFGAITFALFGKSRIETHRLVMDFEKCGGVTLIFQADDGNTYRIVRDLVLDKNRSVSQEVGFFFWSGEKWCRKESDIQKNQTGLQLVINETVGMDYELFCHTVRIQQKDLGSFLEATAGTRRDILKKFVNCTKWDALKELAKKRYSATLDSIDKLDNQIADLKSRAENVDALQGSIGELNRKIESLQKERTSLDSVRIDIQTRLNNFAKIQEYVGRLASLEADLRTKKSSKEDLEATISRTREEYSSDLANYKKEVLGREKFETELSAIQAELDSLDSKSHEVLEQIRDVISKKRDTILSVDKKIAVQEAKIEELRTTKHSISELSAACPTCFSCIDEEHKAKVIEGLREEFGRTKAEWNTCQSILLREQGELKDLVSKESELATALNRQALNISNKARISAILTHLDEWNQKLKDKRAIVNSSLKEMKLSLERIEREIPSIEESFFNLKKESEQAAEDAADPSVLQKSLDIVAGNLSKIEEEIRQHNVSIGQFENRIKVSVSLEQEISEKEMALLRLKEIENTQKLVEKSLGKEGVQAVILENSIDYFESTARSYLKRFTHDQYDLKIETTAKNKKSDTVREELNILIDKGNNVWHPYETFSGAESLKIALAVRIALTQTAAAFNSVKVRFLLIDEIAGSLDPVNRLQFPQILTELAKDFDMILVITHWPEIQEEFSQTITVRKTGFISTIVDGGPRHPMDYGEGQEPPAIVPSVKRPRVDNDFYLAENVE